MDIEKLFNVSIATLFPGTGLFMEDDYSRVGSNSSIEDISRNVFRHIVKLHGRDLDDLFTNFIKKSDKQLIQIAREIFKIQNYSYKILETKDKLRVKSIREYLKTRPLLKNSLKSKNLSKKKLFNIRKNLINYEYNSNLSYNDNNVNLTIVFEEPNLKRKNKSNIDFTVYIVFDDTLLDELSRGFTVNLKN